jgi:xanthine dehydrogenase molybdopterin-binding subunit B
VTVTVSVPHMESQVHDYFTNSPSRTAVRAPGEIQASVGMETVLEHVAAALGVTGMAIRAANLYPEDSPELCKDLAGKDFTSYTIPRCEPQL